MDASSSTPVNPPDERLYFEVPAADIVDHITKFLPPEELVKMRDIVGSSLGKAAAKAIEQSPFNFCVVSLTRAQELKQENKDLNDKASAIRGSLLEINSKIERLRNEQQKAGFFGSIANRLSGKTAQINDEIMKNEAEAKKIYTNLDEVNKKTKSNDAVVKQIGDNLISSNMEERLLFELVGGKEAFEKLPKTNLSLQELTEARSNNVDKMTHSVMRAEDNGVPVLAIRWGIPGTDYQSIDVIYPMQYNTIFSSNKGLEATRDAVRYTVSPEEYFRNPRWLYVDGSIQPEWFMAYKNLIQNVRLDVHPGQREKYGNDHGHAAQLR